ncbi:MAG TPA: pyridoxal phosphate-dependent aminotransferase, partial [Candidatus Eisenbacteria bacterium]
AFTRALAPGDVRGIVIVQPNNPTGSMLDDSELDFLFEQAHAAGATVIADEVFLDFPAPGRELTTLAAGATVPLLVLSGLSKCAGLPQMKLGWMVAAGPPAPAEQLMQGLEWIADAFLSVGAPVQAAGALFLAGRHDFIAATRARCDANEAYLDRLLTGTPVTRLPREGGWSIILRLPATRTDDAWCFELLEAGVVAHPGHYYDVMKESLLVLSLLAPENEWADGLERLLGVVGPG